MGFLARLLAMALEYLVAQAIALGVKQAQEMQTEADAKKKAEEDAAKLKATTDEASRVAALKATISDTFGK